MAKHRIGLDARCERIGVEPRHARHRLPFHRDDTSLPQRKEARRLQRVREECRAVTASRQQPAHFHATVAQEREHGGVVGEEARETALFRTARHFVAERILDEQQHVAGFRRAGNVLQQCGVECVHAFRTDVMPTRRGGDPCATRA